MAVASETLVVHGLAPFLKACAKAEPETRKAIRTELRQAAEGVRADAARKMSAVNSRSAQGYKVRVRQKGIAVEQSIRKTTGQHPEYGSFQMREALLPALEENDGQLARELEKALDRIADRFGAVA